MSCDAQGLAVRQEQVFSAIRERLPAWFDARGRWIGIRKPLHAREQLWLCFGSMTGNDRDRAVAASLIAKAEIPPVGPRQVEFDIFSNNVGTELLRNTATNCRRRRVANWPAGSGSRWAIIPAIRRRIISFMVTTTTCRPWPRSA